MPDVTHFVLLVINDLTIDIKSLNLGSRISNSTQKIHVLLCADDTAIIAEKLFRSSKMLDCVTSWCKRWRLQLNSDKTNVVHFRPVPLARYDFTFKHDDTIIQTVERYKYLGLWLHENLDMRVSTRELVKSANRALGVLFSKFNANGGLSYHVFTHLYDALVAPILAYGAEIWGLTEYSEINTVHNKDCRFFLGISKFAPNVSTNCDMSWYTPLHRQ